MSDLTAIANLSILLVEPSEVQQKLIKKSLAQCGVTQIETASTQENALAALSNYHPDLVISSLYLSDGTADSLLQAIRSNSNTEQQVELEHFDVTLLRVLVVDDSRFARKHIIRVLAGMGILAPVEAEDAKQAIEMLNSQSFDLIVTDYNMPEMDGKELTETVRQSNAYSPIPILMVSSQANDTHLANIAQAGVDTICDKPFEPATVRDLLFKIMS